MVVQGKPKAGTSEWFSQENYLPQCRYTFRRATGGGERCTARATRHDLNYCPEHRCWYHDEAGVQCENGMNTNVFCTSHPCRVPGCERRASAPSSLCQVDHMGESCAYVDEFGTPCPKDPRDGGEYCSKRHRARARQIRKLMKERQAMRAKRVPEPEAPDPDLLLINPKCTCATSFGLPIRHYYTNIECPDRTRAKTTQ